MSVLRPRRAKAAARFTDVVVFPTPPFWLTTARTRPTYGWASAVALLLGAAAPPPPALAPPSPLALDSSPPPPTSARPPFWRPAMAALACSIQRAASPPVGGVARKAS